MDPVVGQQAEGAVPLAAVPAGNARARRAFAQVGAVAGKAAATPRMKGSPRFQCNK